MKKIISLIVALVLSSQAFGQKEVIYGTVRTDGYDKITKGAFWSSRPEAQKIYEGEYPSGYSVYILEKDYYVRFIEKEHNNLDRNYIIFPKGERVYTDSLGVFYSAKCGNRIEYIRPVDQVVVEEKEVIVRDTVRIPVSTNVYNITNNNFFGTEPQPSFQFEEDRETAWKRWIGPTLKCVVISVGAFGVGYGIYQLCEKQGKPASAPITPGGGPASAPITKSLSFSVSFGL